MRYLTAELTRCLARERKMIFISGPRQVGKTTLARSLLAKGAVTSGYFNWDIDAHRKAILKNPDGFWLSQGLTLPKNRVRLVLDEIHKYPRWKRFLKGLYDAHGRELEILVTGSGRLDVYQRGGDSLFGRYALYRLHPFTLGEFLKRDRAGVFSPSAFWNALTETSPPNGAEDGLKKLERFTGFPEPLFAGSPRRMLRWSRSHRDRIIREDLRDLTRIRELGLIESLAELLPGRVGSPLSLNSLREDLNVAFETVQTWIQALDRLYYLFEIRPFAGTLAGALRREAKVYLFDFTVIENAGARFENLVALHLKKLTDAWNDWGFGDFDMHYVRNKQKKEVDFLLTDRKKPYALVEAKLSDREADPSLRYFEERLKPRYAVQVIRESSLPRRQGRILLVPAAHFLSLI